jgi:hypothetical protein
MATAAKAHPQERSPGKRDFGISGNWEKSSPPVLLRFPNVSAREAEPSQRQESPGTAAARPVVENFASAAGFAATTAIGSAGTPPFVDIRRDQPSAADSPATAPTVAAASGIERTWSEQFGSKLVLMVLVAAVVFGTILAMRGQNGVEKMPPLDDLDFSIAEGENAIDSKDKNSKPSGHSPEKSISDSYEFSAPSDEPPAAVPLSAEEILLIPEIPDRSSVAQTIAPPNDQQTTLLTPQESREPSETASNNSPFGGDVTLSGPVTSSPPNAKTQEPWASLDSPSISQKPLSAGPGTSPAPPPVTPSAASVVAYPTTAFPNAIQWQKYLQQDAPREPRVATLPQQPATSVPATSEPSRAYPSTAWPNAPRISSPTTSSSGLAMPPGSAPTGR